MKNKLNIVAKITGILVTLFMLVAFGPSVIESINNNGINVLSKIPDAFLNWYDNPVAFFITYFVGYALLWWKPLLGVIIIVVGDLLFFGFNIQNIGVFIFIIPTFIVAFLYFLCWDNARKKKLKNV